jgi:ribonuclease HI
MSASANRWWWQRTPRLKRVWIFCDGSTGALPATPVRPAGEAQVLFYPGARGGPPALLATSCAAGAVALTGDGQILAWEWQRLEPMSNNEAEYAGFLLGLKLGRSLGATETNCVLDSATVVRQMQGRAAVNSQSLRLWHGRACAAARQIQNLRLRLAPREWNRLADGLAAQAGLSWVELRNHLATMEEG